MSGGDGYIHGFTPVERRRLASQAAVLEPWLYGELTLPDVKTALEVGCGVGAQLEILRRRFPEIAFTGIDREPSQLAAAQAAMAADVAAGALRLLQAEGEKLPFTDGAFDAVLLFWVLEHVPKPAALLAEARRALKPGGTLYATEVFTSSLFLEPRRLALAEYWRHMCARQRQLGGDPDVGARLGTLLVDAGLTRVAVRPISFVLDKRLSDPGPRQRFVDYWRELFLSGAPELLAARLVSPAQVQAMERDFADLAQDPNAVFWMTAVQARAVRR